MSVKEKSRKKRLAKDQVKAMSEGETSAFQAMAVEDPRYYPLFLTLLRSGLRIGEGLGLQLGDVDVAHRELSVKRTLSASARGVSIEDRLDTPKSGEGREVEIGDDLAEALRHQIASRREEDLKRGQTEDVSPWLFATTDGTPLDETRVHKAFKATLRKVGLPLRFVPHSARHTYATLMLAKGAPLTWVSQQLGHSSPQVTLDWNSWAIPSGNRTHASLLDSPLDPKVRWSRGVSW